MAQAFGAPEVFGFRLVAATQQLRDDSKCGRRRIDLLKRVPVYERFFLGDIVTTPGYNGRSISPVAPPDSFVTSRNVTVAANPIGSTIVPIEGLPDALGKQLIALGTFTGGSGPNSAQLGVRDFRFLGATAADRQLEIDPALRPVQVRPRDVGDGVQSQQRGKTSQRVMTTSRSPERGGLPRLARSIIGLVYALSGIVIRDARIVTREDSPSPRRAAHPCRAPLRFRISGAARRRENGGALSESVFSKSANTDHSHELRTITCLNVHFDDLRLQPDARTGSSKNAGIRSTRKESFRPIGAPSILEI